jgi:asparagine synthase (glutamine-hydrolysing)
MEMMYTDVLIYLPQDILAKVDRASMAYSLETRAPFLDTYLIELCFSLPRTWHRRSVGGKRILKDSFYNYFPDKIWRRRKQGFAVPLSIWFKATLAQQLRECLSETSNLPFNKTYVEGLINKHQSGITDYSMLLWSTYVYLIWRKTL